MSVLDPENAERIALEFGIAPALVREIEFMNDEAGFRFDETPEQRFQRVRKWVEEQIL